MHARVGAGEWATEGNGYGTRQVTVIEMANCKVVVGLCNVCFDAIGWSWRGFGKQISRFLQICLIWLPQPEFTAYEYKHWVAVFIGY